MSLSPETLLHDDAEETLQRSGPLKALFKGLVMIASLAAFGFSAREFGLTEALDTRWLDHQIVGRGLNGGLLFVTVGALAAAIGVPRQIVAFGGGYAFGLVEGSLLALLAQTLGCALAFFYARILGRSTIRRLFSGKIARIDALLGHHPFTMTLLVRILPVGSNLLTNLAAGVTSIAPSRFLGGSAVGYIPQTVIFALLGTGVQVDETTRIALSAALFVASGLLGTALYQRLKTRLR